ncbi:MAG: RNA polymerase-binding protein DksA [Candidatus Magasanikbacteria bacterium]|nr:RNA polymerase-binding protein DksA [Candidatus Magasanikbacteria bacterium]
MTKLVVPATKNNISSEFITKIKAMLLEEKARLEHDLTQLAAPSNSAADSKSAFPDYGDKDDENASEVADYAANMSIEQDLGNLLRDVKVALKRWEDGTYGICKYCKKPIEEKRLLARPTSSACVECKKAIMQEV